MAQEHIQKRAPKIALSDFHAIELHPRALSSRTADDDDDFACESPLLPPFPDPFPFPRTPYNSASVGSSSKHLFARL